LFIEVFGRVLVLIALFFAAEKHDSTHLEPVWIALVSFACHMFGVGWTGCGINPASAFGPHVTAA
ncbi:uncharacterized protein FA14DRAFT_128527, partial [Meira miltonrushii]